MKRKLKKIRLRHCFKNWNAKFEINIQNNKNKEEEIHIENNQHKEKKRILTKKIHKEKETVIFECNQFEEKEMNLSQKSKKIIENTNIENKFDQNSTIENKFEEKKTEILKNKFEEKEKNIKNKRYQKKVIKKTNKNFLKTKLEKIRLRHCLKDWYSFDYSKVELNNDHKIYSFSPAFENLKFEKIEKLDNSFNSLNSFEKKVVRQSFKILLKKKLRKILNNQDLMKINLNLKRNLENWRSLVISLKNYYKEEISNKLKGILNKNYYEKEKILKLKRYNRYWFLMIIVIESNTLDHDYQLELDFPNNFRENFYKNCKKTLFKVKIRKLLRNLYFELKLKRCLYIWLSLSKVLSDQRAFNVREIRNKKMIGIIKKYKNNVMINYMRIFRNWLIKSLSLSRDSITKKIKNECMARLIKLQGTKMSFKFIKLNIFNNWIKVCNIKKLSEMQQNINKSSRIKLLIAKVNFNLKRNLEEKFQKWIYNSKNLKSLNRIFEIVLKNLFTILKNRQNMINYMRISRNWLIKSLSLSRDSITKKIKNECMARLIKLQGTKMSFKFIKLNIFNNWIKVCNIKKLSEMQQNINKSSRIKLLIAKVNFNLKRNLEEKFQKWIYNSKNLKSLNRIFEIVLKNLFTIFKNRQNMIILNKIQSRSDKIYSLKLMIKIFRNCLFSLFFNNFSEIANRSLKYAIRKPYNKVQVKKGLSKFKKLELITKYYNQWRRSSIKSKFTEISNININKVIKIQNLKLKKICYKQQIKLPFIKWLYVSSILREKEFLFISLKQRLKNIFVIHLKKKAIIKIYREYCSIKFIQYFERVQLRCTEKTKTLFADKFVFWIKQALDFKVYIHKKKRMLTDMMLIRKANNYSKSKKYLLRWNEENKLHKQKIILCEKLNHLIMTKCALVFHNISDFIKRKSKYLFIFRGT